MWPFRSPSWKQQTKSVFRAEDPESGRVHRIVLTNAGILTLERERRVYFYAKSWWQHPAEAIARAWGFTSIVAVDPDPHAAATLPPAAAAKK